jgi:hypothetical protein
VRRLAALIAFGLMACVAAFSNEDVARLHDIETMTLLAYDSSDAATPAAQYDRAAFCAAQGVLRESDAGRLADASIQCERARQ